MPHSPAHLVDLHCPGCCASLPFEAVPCDDGHGDDCPDVVCTGCGLVLVTGLPTALGVATQGRAAVA